MLLNNTISLVIPCKDEALSLEKMLKKCPQFIDEIIVVDNNSNDNTREIALKYGAKVLFENRHINGIGYGFAHRTGILNARGDYIVAMDGDNTYPLESIDKLVRYSISNNIDLLSASRYPLYDKKSTFWFRKLGVSILNFEVRLLYRYWIKDILSGMWVIRRSIVDKINPQCGDWNYSPEIKLLALTNKKIVFSEIPIKYYKRIYGTSKQNLIYTGISHFIFILQFRLKLLIEKYWKLNLPSSLLSIRNKLSIKIEN